MNAPARTLLLAFALAGGLGAQAQPPVATGAFEIGTSNLFEALRQLAACRDLDLVIDPEVPNREALYAFRHTTWEKALDAIASSHGLTWEIRDGILRVGQASRLAGEAQRSAASQLSRTISITYRPAPEGEALLSVSVNRATRPEILAALAKVERIAKARQEKRPFSANWVLRPTKATAREEFETFAFEDITPGGLRALYP